MANTLHLVQPYDHRLKPGDRDYDSFDDLWSRLARPFDVAFTWAALVGLPVKAVQQLVGISIASSPQANQLLDEFPATVRSLATSLKLASERCHGSLRGPVLWSETVAARAASYGADDVYVCQTPSRAYDIDENRVLVAALVAVRDAAEHATTNSPELQDRRLMEACRRNGLHAARFCAHPSLANVSREPPVLRAQRRARSGRHRASYRPAIHLLEHALEPLSVDQVRVLCDERTRAQHQILMRLVHRLEQHGGPMPEFRVQGSSLGSGPVRYFHARRLGGPKLSGILVGDLLVDVPDRPQDPSRARATAQLEARAGGRPALVVMDDNDIERAVALAIDRALG
jgi:hypothetical protein